MSQILVIDDSPVTRTLVSSLLKYMGHSVVEAENGMKGMRAFHQGGIDLVITDLVMPDQEGVETICQIRKLDTRVPILAMSGDDHNLGCMDYLTLTLELGANDTLRKPFPLDSLCQKVEALLPVPA